MNFGEILEPSSRAFWDGFDELEEEQCTAPKLSWNWCNEDGKERYPKELNLFLVIEGSNVTDFLKSAVLKNERPVCTVTGNNIAIYYFPNTKTAICVSEENDLNLSGLSTEILLISWLELARKVTTVSIQAKILYKGSDWKDIENITFVRGINSEFSYVEELETPNFITGISAGAAYWRYFKNLEVFSYVVYTDSPELDVISTEPILKLLKNIGIKCDDKYIQKIKSQSHLYM